MIEPNNKEASKQLLESISVNLRPVEIPATDHSNIYFLLLEGEVVYVGKSVHVAGRMVDHVDTKEFDAAVCFNIRHEAVYAVEYALISLLRPRYNRIGGSAYRYKESIQTIEKELGIQLPAAIIAFGETDPTAAPPLETQRTARRIGATLKGSALEAYDKLMYMAIFRNNSDLVSDALRHYCLSLTGKTPQHKEQHMDDRATTVLCLVWSKYREQASGGTYCADDDNDALMAVEEHLMCNAVIDGDGRFTDEAPDVFAEDGGAL